jgi:pyruvate/2-oxoglutarate dehydrogenase complex dihydrolipoamide dehydrogenase (E3) component
MPQQFDAVVIGTGQGGAPLAVRLGESGRRTAVIERGAFGGTCVNAGCTPTKTYVASARAAHVTRHAGDFGVLVGSDVTVDLAKVKARKDEVVGESRTGVENWLRGADNVTVFGGHARFAGPHTISVSDRDGRVTDEIEAREIFINTGTRALIPRIDGIDRIRYYTNSTLLDLTTLPEHLAIIGGSYVALEFAQIFRRFGSRVTVLVRGDRVLGREDADFANAMQEVLTREGVEFRFSAEPARVEPSGVDRRGVRIGFIDSKHASLDATHLLIATGRIPNTDDLGLDSAGIAVDSHGIIPVDGQLRSSLPHVYVIGDANGRGAFTHTSYDDFQIIATNLLGGGADNARSADDRIMAYAVYVDPPFARVGLSETEVRKRHTNALIATMPMTRVGRAVERGETDGFMKVLVDARTERILGAAILGIEGDEAIHTFIDIMTAGATFRTLRDAMHIHPTISELIPTLLEGLQPLGDTAHASS